jgi:hypothetical protein
MSSKTIRSIFTVAVLAVTLTVTPALAAGPQIWKSPATSVETTLSDLWNFVSSWLPAGRGPTAAPAGEKEQGPPYNNNSCNGPDPGCASVHPNGKDKVGSGIDPDGRPF